MQGNLMLFLLFIFYLFRWDTQAIPVPVLSSSSLSATATSGTSTSQRSMFSIVWSCLSTVIICAWVSVHPNVPPRSQRRALWRRLKLMFWTIVVPELVLAWAVRQWTGAKMISNKYKGHGWTMMHGHFLIMGGFSLVHADVNVPKEPTRPKLSFSFRFWRNADDREQGDTVEGEIILGGRGREYHAQSIYSEDRRRSDTEPKSLFNLQGSSHGIHSLVRSISPSSPRSIPQVYSPTRMPRIIRSFSSGRPGSSDVSAEGQDGLNGILKSWKQRDEEEWQRWQEEKQRFEEEKQRYGADKQHYEAEDQNFEEEKQRYEVEKKTYEESQRGEEERWQYEKSRQSFEKAREAYEDRRSLYEESWRQYQETRQKYLDFREMWKRANGDYGEIWLRRNGAEIQRGYGEALALYQEQTKRHDEQQKKYEEIGLKYKQARRDYEKAREQSDGLRLRNRKGKQREDAESEEKTRFEEKKRLYTEEEAHYEKARTRYKQKSQLYDEATERYKVATANYREESERIKVEGNRGHQQEEQQIDEESQRLEEERRLYAEERERYEEARRRYEAERKLYEEERIASEAIQHAADELERSLYEIERQQYEERRRQFEEEGYNEEQKLRRYEEELLRYEEKLHEYEENCRRYQLGPLSFDHFQRLLYESKIDFPRITLEEIEDKSKADFLSKMIAILQTTWFLFQCIARGVQGLAITELELVTLALASFNAVTYACWWNKPLGIQDPARIYLKIEVEGPAVKRAVSKMPEATVRRVLDTILQLLAKFLNGFLGVFGAPFAGGGGHCGQYFLLIWVPSFLVFFVILISIVFLSLFPLSIAVLLRVIKPTPPVVEKQPTTTRQLIATRIIIALRAVHYGLTSSISNFFQEGFSDVWNNSFSFLMGLFIIFPLFFLLLLGLLLLLLPFFTLSFLVSFLFTSVFGIITTNTINPGATQVPSFYACKTDSDRYSRMIVFAFFGVIFGGLHIIGWNFSYPTSYERTLWRITSLIITLIPLIVAPIDYFLTNREENPKRSLLATLALSSLDLAMTILLFAYVPARLSLIAQAFALLRIQPLSAFIAVDWTAYIPHIEPR